MKPFDRGMALEVVAEASRAPSAHNTQPARWRFTARGEALLFEDTGRRLPVGDPTGRDQLISLGAAFEGLRLALSRRGFDLADPGPLDPGGDDATVAGRAELNLVARAAIWPGTGPDPLAAFTARRRTYRGRFLPAAPAALAALRVVLEAAGDVVPVHDPRDIAALARLADEVSTRCFARRAFQEEVWRWTRFTPAAGDGDGLTAECLGLSALERRVGRWLFVPHRFAVLARLGWHGPFIAEAGRIRGAAALVILHHAPGAWLAAGRRFFRLWLEITRAGFDARPMSALVDDADAVAALRARGGPAGAVPVNVFAVGAASPSWRCRSPRLPAHALIV